MRFSVQFSGDFNRTDLLDRGLKRTALLHDMIGRKPIPWRRRKRLRFRGNSIRYSRNFASNVTCQREYQDHIDAVSIVDKVDRSADIFKWARKHLAISTERLRWELALRQYGVERRLAGNCLVCCIEPTNSACPPRPPNHEPFCRCGGDAP